MALRLTLRADLRREDLFFVGRGYGTTSQVSLSPLRGVATTKTLKPCPDTCLSPDSYFCFNLSPQHQAVIYVEHGNLN